VIFAPRGYFRVVNRWWGLVLVLMSSGFSLGAQPKVAVLTVYYTERPPSCLVDGQTGVVLELAKAVLAEAGLRGRFIELPADRILNLLWAGPTDAVAVGWYRKADRESMGRYSQPLYQEPPMVAVVNARAAERLAVPVRLETLLGSSLTLGAKTGGSFGPLFDQKVRAQGLVPVETTSSVAGLLHLVAEGRMDYTFLPGDEARYYLDRDRDPGLADLAVVKIAEPYPGNLRYFFFPASLDPSVAQRLDAAVDRVRARAAEFTAP